MMRPGELRVGDRVTRNEPSAAMAGTVIRLVGERRAGGGVAARVAWDNGESGKVAIAYLKRAPAEG